MEKKDRKAITRRDALKRMGWMAAGAAALSLSTLTSCGEKKRRRVIFYFTATGNSLYVARQLADEGTEKRWHEPVTDIERAQHEGFMRYTGADPEVGFVMRSEKYFTVTDACIGCAVCAEVCPRGNYELTPEGVKTKGDCDFCFACIQNCPQKAIQFAHLPDDKFLARGEVNPNARYRNEHVSLWSIKEANRQ